MTGVHLGFPFLPEHFIYSFQFKMLLTAKKNIKQKQIRLIKVCGACVLYHNRLFYITLYIPSQVNTCFI